VSVSGHFNGLSGGDHVFTSSAQSKRVLRLSATHSRPGVIEYRIEILARCQKIQNPLRRHRLRQNRLQNLCRQIRRQFRRCGHDDIDEFLHAFTTKKMNAADFNEAKKRLFYKRQCAEMVKKLQTSFAWIDDMKRARRSLALSRRAQLPPRNELIAIRRDHIKLRMRPEHNHELPHFHLEYKQLYTASYQIQPFRKLAGDMPKKYEKKLSDWIENNQANLLATWAALKAGKNVHELVIARD
jgi:hypothetical protein